MEECEVLCHKCGIRIQPPALVLTYSYSSSDKIRRRTMPLRFFNANSKIETISEELRNNPRHQKFVKKVQRSQLENLLKILKECLNGSTIKECLQRRPQPKVDLNSNQDLNRDHVNLKEGLDSFHLSPKKKLEELYSPKEDFDDFNFDPSEDLEDFYNPKKDLEDLYNPSQDLKDLYNPKKALKDLYNPNQDLKDLYNPNQDLKDLYNPNQDLSRCHINSDEDLNKLGDKELAAKKAIMEKLFEKNVTRPGDKDFVYDIQVEYSNSDAQNCSWDSDCGSDAVDDAFDVVMETNRDKEKMEKEKNEEGCKDGDSSYRSRFARDDGKLGRGGLYINDFATTIHYHDTDEDDDDDDDDDGFEIEEVEEEEEAEEDNKKHDADKDNDSAADDDDDDVEF